jgi:hypothetical protein
MSKFIKNNFPLMVLIIIVLMGFRTCSVTKTNDKLVRQNKVLELRLDSISKTIPTYEQMELLFIIYGAKNCENMLNDYNDFARSKASPTERSRYYQDIYNKAQEKLKK